jgi:transcriptional regulator with XRE-family HTH domain
MARKRQVTAEGLRIGRAVARRRAQAHMTKGQLAQYARVSLPWLSQLEAGYIPGPSVQMMHRIARALGTTLDELLRDAANDDVGAMPVPLEKVGPIRRLLRYSADQLDRLAETAALLFVEPVPSPDEQAEQAAHEQPQEQRQQERDQDAPSHHAQLRRLNGLTPGLQPAHLPT